MISSLLLGLISLTAVGQVATPTKDKPAEKHPAASEIADAVKLFSSRRFDQSLSKFCETSEKYSDLPLGEILFSQVAFQAKQPQLARKALERAAVDHADNPQVWNTLGNWARREGRYAAAELLLQRALETATASDQKSDRLQLSRTYVNLANVYERRGQWQRAKTYWQKLIDAEPSQVDALMRLAAIHFKLNEVELTRQVLDKYEEEAEDALPASVLIGQFFQSSGQIDEAKAAMKQAMQTHGADLKSQVAIARWAMTSGQKAMLDAASQNAKRIAPDSPGVDSLRGMSARFSGDVETAKSIFTELHDRDPSSFDATNGLSLSLLASDESKDQELALKLAQVLVERHRELSTPKGRAAAATFSFALHRNGKHPEAKKVIQQVIESGEVSPEVGYFAAEIFAAAEDYLLANQLLQASLASPIAFPQKSAAQQLQSQLATKL